MSWLITSCHDKTDHSLYKMSGCSPGDVTCMQTPLVRRFGCRHADSLHSEMSMFGWSCRRICPDSAESSPDLSITRCGPNAYPWCHHIPLKLLFRPKRQVLLGWQEVCLSMRLTRCQRLVGYVSNLTQLNQIHCLNVSIQYKPKFQFVEKTCETTWTLWTCLSAAGFNMDEKTSFL